MYMHFFCTIVDIRKCDLPHFFTFPVSRDMPDNIWILASDGQTEAVKQLINSGTSINAQDENGYSVLTAAISWNHFELTRWLVQNGADINIRDEDGETPLFVVESLEAAKLLIELGANFNATNHDGQTVRSDDQFKNYHVFALFKFKFTSVKIFP